MQELKWWQKTNVYQIYPKSFLDTTGSGTGDLQGVTAKLDYLKTLGVGAVWLTPVYPSPGVDNGYDISDYTAIDPAYGTMADMENLIGEARRRDIRIVMDLVFNHSSDQHPWFLESASSRTNPKADWYIWRDAPTNWRSIFGGSAWEWCEARGQYYLHTFAKEQPDLNWENPEVRRALYEAANFWLEKGVGGFRIDAIVYIKKPEEFLNGEPDGRDGLVSIHAMTANTPGILDFLHEFRREVFDGHDIFTVGEANSVKPEELTDWVGEKGAFSMLFEFSHMNLAFKEQEIWCRPGKWQLKDLKQALSESQQATAEKGWYPIFFENHDQIRCVDKYFPRGADRVKAAKAMATVLLTLRGTPFIYQGQELGLANVAWDSIDCYDDVSSHGQYAFALEEGCSAAQALACVQRWSRDNARTPMQWTRGLEAGFTAGHPWLPVHEDYSRQCVETEAEDSDSVLSYYRRLARLRGDSEAAEILQRGDYLELLPEDGQIYAFRRSQGGRQVTVLVNFTAEAAAYDAGLLQGAGKLTGNYEDDRRGCLRPLEAAVYLGKENRHGNSSK